MKNLVLVLLLSCSATLVAQSADTVIQLADVKSTEVKIMPEKTPWFSDVSVSVYGGVEHPEFSKPEWGAGFEAAVSPNDKVSILVDVFSFETDNWRDQTVDRVSLLGQYELFKSNNKRVNLYGIGGAGYNFREDNFLLSAGLGVGVNVYKEFSVFADSRVYSEFNASAGESSRFGISYSF